MRTPPVIQRWVNHRLAAAAAAAAANHALRAGHEL